MFAGLPIPLAGICLGIMGAMHLGTLCQSFTMARVPAVRTKMLPLGLPALTQAQPQLVEMGFQLVSVSDKLCFTHHAAVEYSRLKILPESAWDISRGSRTFSVAWYYVSLNYYLGTEGSLSHPLSVSLACPP